MNADDIILFARRFFTEPFRRHEAITLFGTVDKVDPATLIIKPHPTRGERRITLEIAAIDGEEIVAGVILEFDQAQQILITDLIREWGAGQQKPRLKPDQPIPIQFLVKTQRWRGYVLLQCEKIALNNKVDVKRVFFRRSDRD